MDHESSSPLSPVRTPGSVRSSFVSSLLDAQRTTTVATAVLLGLFDDLRALVARESSTALLANHPPVWQFEPLAVL